MLKDRREADSAVEGACPRHSSPHLVEPSLVEKREFKGIYKISIQSSIY